ncbi:hypothetical protein HELRODRAFT_194961, partial [Helobdella robusta]|uniref:VWFA domain-containing protein n=1 Tax=Helobdella robusta TaxID=6412 RepID=T1FWL8_HELRO
MSSNFTATWQEAVRTRVANVKIVGVGQDIDMNELVAVATSAAPSTPQSNVFVASNYTTLSDQLTNKISSAICAEFHVNELSVMLYPTDFKYCNSTSCMKGQCIEEFGGFSCKCPSTSTGTYCERDKTRIGIIVYSDDAELSIRMNDYWIMQDLITAFKRVLYKGQKTNTASALNLLYTQAFTSFNGDRSDVPNVAVIVTDGNSNVNPSSTVDEAIACRLAGIRLVTASIGDSVNPAEINNIASFPLQFNTFNVSNYTLFDKLVHLVVQATCDSFNECLSNTCQPRGTCVNLFHSYQCRCQRFYAGLNCERYCTVRSDVVIVLDVSGSIGYLEDWYNMLISFAREIINGLDVDNDVARVAIVAYSTDVIKTIYFNQYIGNRTKLLESLNFYHDGGTTNTQAALYTVANSVFDSNRGYRGNDNGVLKSVILLSDGESNVQAENTVPAANNLKRLGARVYSVVVGTDINYAEMERVSSNATLYTYRMPYVSDVVRVASKLLT